MVEALDIAVFKWIGFMERVGIDGRHSIYRLYIYKLNFICFCK
jgi:hypothetical protein